MGFVTDVNAQARRIHAVARSKGFWDHEEMCGSFTRVPVKNPSIALEKIALMHSELSEALESERNGDTNTEEELADVVIRVLDFCAWRGYNIGAAIEHKIGVNVDRPHKHGRVI